MDRSVKGKGPEGYTYTAAYLWAYYNCDTSTIRVRFEYDSTAIRLQHATTRYEVFRSRVRTS